MSDQFKPRNRREHKQRNFMVAGRSGRIQWTARGVHDCVRHLQNEWKALAAQGKEKDWEPYAEVLVYVRQKYSGVTGSAHYYRMACVINFLHDHMRGLKQAGIVKRDTENYGLWDDALFEAFAKLPYKSPEGFSFTDVKNFVVGSKKPN
jgi:hypothetical protein